MDWSAIKYYLPFFTISFLFSFTVRKNLYQTECISTNSDGYTTILIWSPQRGNSYKREQAYKDGLDAILFSGIAGNKGCMTQPPILTKQEDIEKFKRIEKSFFSKDGEWSVFIHSGNVETTSPEFNSGRKVKAYHVSIAKNLLIKNLEMKKIINTLNSGF